MIKIALVIGGKQKEFYSKGVRMRTCLDAYALCAEYDKAEGVYDEALIDRCLDFIVDAFGHQFDREDLLNGYVGSPYILIPQILREIITYVHDRIIEFPPKAAALTTVQD